MKKILSILVTVFLTVTLVGCSQSTDKEEENVEYYAVVGNNINGTMKYGVVDSFSTLVIPTQFDSVTIEENGFIYVSNEYTDSLTQDTMSLDGLYNYNGTEILPCEYYSIEKVSDSNIITATKYNESTTIYTHYVYDLEGNEIFSTEGTSYKEIDDFNGLHYAEITLSNYGETENGAIDKYGNVFISSEYDEIMGYWDSDYFGVRKDGLYGYINKSYEEVIPCIYKAVTPFNSNGMAFVVTTDDVGILINTENKVVKEYGDESTAILPIEKLKNGDIMPLTGELKDMTLCIANSDVEQLSALYGYMDKNGEVVLDCEYAEASEFNEDGLAIVRNKKYASGVINRQLLVKNIHR